MTGWIIGSFNDNGINLLTVSCPLNFTVSKDVKPVDNINLINLPLHQGVALEVTGNTNHFMGTKMWTGACVCADVIGGPLVDRYAKCDECGYIWNFQTWGTVKQYGFYTYPGSTTEITKGIGWKEKGSKLTGYRCAGHDGTAVFTFLDGGWSNTEISSVGFVDGTHGLRLTTTIPSDCTTDLVKTANYGDNIGWKVLNN